MIDNPPGKPNSEGLPGPKNRPKPKFIRYVSALVLALVPIWLAIRSIRSYDAFVETLPDDAHVSGTPVVMALAGATILVPIFAIIGLILGIICEKLIASAQPIGSE